MVSFILIQTAFMLVLASLICANPVAQGIAGPISSSSTATGTVTPTHTNSVNTCACSVSSKPTSISTTVFAVTSAPPATMTSDGETRTFSTASPPPTGIFDSPITPSPGDELQVATNSQPERRMADIKKLKKRGKVLGLPKGCVTVYKDPDFKGASWSQCGFTSGVCYTVLLKIKDDISSFKPGKNTECVVYDEPFCTGVYSEAFQPPGYGNLGEQFDDKVRSFRCT